MGSEMCIRDSINAGTKTAIKLTAPPLASNISFLLVVGKLDANNFVDRYQYRNCTYKVFNDQILLNLSVGVGLELLIFFQSLQPLFNVRQLQSAPVAVYNAH